ncbi:MAG: thermonuclease family protein [Phycisphaerae bacterium]|nr:thermonuclease family protein [Phycisphaerae bacterium]
MTKNNKQKFAISRKTRTFFLVVFLLIAFFLIRLDRSRIRVTPTFENGDKTAEVLPLPDIDKYHQKTFSVVKVVDGDTFDIDEPDGKYNHTRIRLWGVDTPETKNSNKPEMYFGREASEFAKKILSGKKVKILLSEKKTRGKYGRLLAYVQLPDGKIFNELIVEDGYGYADMRFEHLYYFKYQQLERKARKAGKGLWENVEQGQLPEWLVNRRPEILEERKR